MNTPLSCILQPYNQCYCLRVLGTVTRHLEATGWLLFWYYRSMVEIENTRNCAAMADHFSFPLQLELISVFIYFIL